MVITYPYTTNLAYGSNAMGHKEMYTVKASFFGFEIRIKAIRRLFTFLRTMPEKPQEVF